MPDSGEVIFAGQPTAQLTDDARVELRTHACGYLFSSPFLLAQFSAKAVVPAVTGSLKSTLSAAVGETLVAPLAGVVAVTRGAAFTSV